LRRLCRATAREPVAMGEEGGLSRSKKGLEGFIKRRLGILKRLQKKEILGFAEREIPGAGGGGRGRRGKKGSPQ